MRAMIAVLTASLAISAGAQYPVYAVATLIVDNPGRLLHWCTYLDDSNDRYFAVQQSMDIPCSRFFYSDRIR